MADLLWAEPVGGMAGDMFLAAALDAGVPEAELTRALATIPMQGWRLEVTEVRSGGIRGRHVEVRVDGKQPGARALADILDLVRKSGLPPRARQAALALFERVGRAESRVHGVPLEQCHFHEVGAVDSIVDLCGAAVVMELLGWPRAVSTPPELGQGWVKTAHGLLPVPAPAVLEILSGLPVRPGGPAGEAVTPTGAAILAGLFELGTPPPFTPRRIGYGAGTSRWLDRANVLRLTVGELSGGGAAGAVLLLEANLDDCPGQLVARAIEAALEQGALDAWAVPVTMKKGRPGLVLSALVPAGRREEVARVFLTETTTLGVRFQPVERTELERESVPVETPYGTVRVKVGRRSGEELNAHPEWEDCAALARQHGVPVKRVLEEAVAAWRRR